MDRDPLLGMPHATRARREAVLREARAEPDPGIENLIERSSLGTPEAKALRASVPDDVARAIVAQASEAAPVSIRIDSDSAHPITPVGEEPTYEIPHSLWKALCDAHFAVDEAEMAIMRYVGEHYPAADEARAWVREYDV